MGKKWRLRQAKEAAPTSAEIMELHESRNLFKSNLFRCQLEELCKEITPNAEHLKSTEPFLRQLKDVLTALPNKELSDFEDSFPELSFFAHDCEDFTFSAPERVDLVGSFLLKNQAKPRVNVDLALTIPGESLQSKDYLNGRYLDKRVAFVGQMYNCLKEIQSKKAGKKLFTFNDRPVEMVIDFLNQDVHKPIVVLTLSAGTKKIEPITVRLLPVVSSQQFKQSALAPTRNALRARFMNLEEDIATPHYNCRVLEDMRMIDHLKMLHECKEKYSAFADTVKMLKTWGSQRGFFGKKDSFTGVSGFFLAICCAHVLKSGDHPHTLSSNQLFKLVMAFLKETDFRTKKVVFGQQFSTDLSADEKKLFKCHFYDADEIFNFGWRVSCSIDELSHEATRCITLLESSEDPFDEIFGLRSRTDLTLDVTVRINEPDESLSGKDSVTMGEAPVEQKLGEELLNLLEKGLGDRMSRGCVRYHVNDDGSRGVSLGLLVNSMNANRILDQGPSADKPEAKQFRALWGNKSELRRFQDGSILECVVWKAPTRSGPKAVFQKDGVDSVVSQIIEYLIGLHFPGLDSQAVVMACHPLGCTTSGDLNRDVWLKFEDCRKHLCAMSSLPLEIKQVVPVGDAFSYTDVNHVQMQDGAIKRQRQEAIIEFESSSAWPKDPEAVKRVKTALLLKIKDEYTTDLGIDSDITPEFLDVKYPEYVFRLWVVHPSELWEMSQECCNFKATGSPDYTDFSPMRKFWWAPKFRGKLHALCMKNPSLAAAVRLAKVWAQYQLLDGYDFLIEHLMIHVFTCPGQYDTPNTPHIALGRFFELLATFDWQNQPLIVEIDDELEIEERHEMRLSHERNSNKFGAPAMWIATRYDPHVLLLQIPQRNICDGLIALAKNALAAYSKIPMLCTGDNSKMQQAWQVLFKPEMSVFDVVINMKKSNSNAGASKMNPKKRKADGEPVTSAEMDRYVTSLRENFASVAVFFPSPALFSVGVKFKAKSFQPQNARMMMTALPHIAVAGDDPKKPTIMPNLSFILESFRSLGKGLVTDVITQKGCPDIPEA